MKIRWGILGTAQIARKNWLAIRSSGNSVVEAVASRDAERSRRFIEECHAEAPMETVPRAFGSYEELLASKDVQAVYIPLPTGLRREWVIRAARAGKHVVCEKPCAVSAADLREMTDACRGNGVQFMDGVMFMHSLRMNRMREVLDDAETIGDIRRIESSFSFCAPPEFYEGNIRAQSEMEPHGCMGDLGWYCIRYALWAMRWQMPMRVSASILSGFTPPGESHIIPTELSAELHFDGGVSAGFYCSFKTFNQQWALVSGTKGYLRVDDFVLPFSGDETAFETQQMEFRVSGCDFQMVPAAKRFPAAEPGHGLPGAQESNLFRSFSEAIQSGVLNSEWPDMALRTQDVMDACLESARQDGRYMCFEAKSRK